MTSPAAIQGDYTDLRFIKGRKVCQVVIELPIEAGVEFVKIFGTPIPSSNVQVAIARINPDAKPERRGGKLAQRAGIICHEQAFWEFLGSNIARKILPRIYENIDHEEQAALAVRDICGVLSRAELDHQETAGKRFLDLESTYRAWLSVPA